MLRTGTTSPSEPCGSDRSTGHLVGQPKLAPRPEYKDTVAGYPLSLRLPDTTVMRLSKCCTASERWEMVSNEYLGKRLYAQVNLHQSFVEMRCAKGGLTSFRT